MSRRPAAFTRADLKRAIDAIHAAGLVVSRIELDRTARIVVGSSAVLAVSSDDELNRELGTGLID